MKYHETSVQVRFYEVDAYGVVWHGHYAGWFEAGRNDLTQRFQMGPLQLKEMIFHYRVLGQENGKVLATGSTTHVLTDLKGNLLYRVPPAVFERIEAMRKYLEV
jgi:acyl-CoA thioester hydrolase